MNDLKGQNAIITGASGGIGAFISRTLAAEGVNLFLVAYPGEELSSLSEELPSYGVKAKTAALDLRDEQQRREVVRQATAQLGGVDILVNNAGVEFNGFYHQLSEAHITEVLSVNLEAPMTLTRLLLPEMLERGRGHIVNISSLAGKSGPAFQEPYAASKAALTAFTFSLRGSYHGTGVSASVICPGFVEAGIYARLKARTGCSAPRLLGACAPERVARAVVDAIKRDLPEIIVNRYPVRPLLVLMALSPSAGAWLMRVIGVHEFFRRVVHADTKGVEG